MEAESKAWKVNQTANVLLRWTLSQKSNAFKLNHRGILLDFKRIDGVDINAFLQEVQDAFNNWNRGKKKDGKDRFRKASHGH